MIKRICYKCKEELPLNSDNFFKNKTKKYGFDNKCKRCASKSTRQWVLDNKDRANRYRKEQREKKLTLGLCGHCGKKRLPFSNTFCEACYYRDMSMKHLGTRARWKELKSKYLEQNKKCFYTGEKLIFGVNASVDHINPRVRFDKEKNNIDNLVWCTSDINRMKTDNTYSEFIKKCNKIISYEKTRQGKHF